MVNVSLWHLSTMRTETHCADVNNYVVMSVVDYDAIEPMVEVTNMMTGKKYKESINTPSYMSASSEAYWSM